MDWKQKLGKGNKTIVYKQKGRGPAPQQGGRVKLYEVLAGAKSFTPAAILAPAVP